MFSIIMKSIVWPYTVKIGDASAIFFREVRLYRGAFCREVRFVERWIFQRAYFQPTPPFRWSRDLVT